jgi:hypothetical protein
MTTPMVTNMKLLSDSSSDLVDPTMYRQLIGSLMYLVNTRRDICFVVNTLSQYTVEPRHVHLVATMLNLELLYVLFNLLDYNSISRIIQKIHNHKVHNIYPGKPSWGRKPIKNFLNIDCQYNAKIKDQTQKNVQH